MSTMASLPDPFPVAPLPGPLDGVAPVPGSKSITNRALVCAALARGTSSLTGALFADDTEAMIGVLAALGIEVTADERAATITISGCDGRVPPTSAPLDTRQSGTTSPLGPGSSQSTDVVFTNLGAANASSFVLTPGACTSSPSTGTPTPNNLCTTDLTVAISCSGGSTYAAGSAWTDLVYAAGAAASIPTLTHTPGLASGASATCRTTVALPAGASVLDQGLTLSQPLSWTLNK